MRNWRRNTRQNPQATPSRLIVAELGAHFTPDPARVVRRLACGEWPTQPRFVTRCSNPDFLPSLQNPDVIRSLVFLRVGESFLTQQPSDLRNGLEVVLLEPGFEAADEGVQVIHSVAKQCGGCHYHIGTGQQVFHHLIGRMHARGCGEGDRDPVAQQRDPEERQTDLGGRAEFEAGRDFEGGQIDVGAGRSD